jgi:hypothetical protein
MLFNQRIASRAKRGGKNCVFSLAINSITLSIMGLVLINHCLDNNGSTISSVRSL